MEENIDNKITRLEKHRESHIVNKRYSVQRIDLLTVAIGGSCIYYLLNSEPIPNYQLAIAFCSVAIGLNFLSQWSGYLANVFEVNWTVQEIWKLEKNNKFNVEKHKCWDNLVSILNPATTIINVLSSTTLIIGVIIIWGNLF